MIMWSLQNLQKNPVVDFVEPDLEFQALAEEIPWGISTINALKSPVDSTTRYSDGAGIIVGLVVSCLLGFAGNGWPVPQSNDTAGCNNGFHQRILKIAGRSNLLLG